LAVIEEFIRQHGRKNKIVYVGARGGVERDALEKFIERRRIGRLEIREITCGKLRRYFSFKNFIDFFKVPFGIAQSFFIVLGFKPEVVFSKGGFVAVPVVIGARLAGLFLRGRITIVIHESDVVPGLANRISAKFADKIFVSFEESVKFFHGRALGRVTVTGNPVRREIFGGVRDVGLKLCGFNRFKNVIFAMGGSQGALQINNLVWNNLDEILKKYQVVHIVGKGNFNIGVKKAGYKQFELLFGELKDVYACSSIVVSRGGANSLAEISALNKKAVIIPLGTETSRGDQIKNSKVCAEKYGWHALYGDVTGEQFLRAIDIANRSDASSEKSPHKGAAKEIAEKLLE